MHPYWVPSVAYVVALRKPWPTSNCRERQQLAEAPAVMLWNLSWQLCNIQPPSSQPGTECGRDSNISREIGDLADGQPSFRDSLTSIHGPKKAPKLLSCTGIRLALWSGSFQATLAIFLHTSVFPHQVFSCLTPTWSLFLEEQGQNTLNSPLSWWRVWKHLPT